MKFVTPGEQADSETNVETLTPFAPQPPFALKTLLYSAANLGYGMFYALNNAVLTLYLKSRYPGINESLLGLLGSSHSFEGVVIQPLVDALRSPPSLHAGLCDTVRNLPGADACCRTLADRRASRRAGRLHLPVHRLLQCCGGPVRCADARCFSRPSARARDRHRDVRACARASVGPVIRLLKQSSGWWPS